MGSEMSKKIVITQSNYIPWKGYFDAIALADEWIEYDDMQYTKRDWRNRNLIKTANGAVWLTIPVEVKGKFFQKIRDTKISESNWNINHWRTIQSHYSKSPFYKEMKEQIENLYMTATSEWLTEVNLHFIQGINKILQISTPILSSSSFELKEDRNERLLHICNERNATDYYSGPAAKAYMDESIFENRGIQVHYLDYSNYQEYPQLFPPFTHAVTILDLLFNVGNEAPRYMKHVNSPTT
jgi:hypothetical protein